MICLFCNFKSKQNNSLSSPQEYVIQHLGRWKRVNLLRQTSSQAVELGYKGDTKSNKINDNYDQELYNILIPKYHHF